MAEKPIQVLTTGEYFQPVRLHYQVRDRKALLAALERLNCVQSDPAQPRWVWLYEHEAKGLPFKQSYDQVPRGPGPIIIGSFRARKKDELLLDLRSHERATLAIVFFDQHIPREAARVTEAEVVNKLFTAEDAKLPLEVHFDRQETTCADHETELRELGDRIAQIKDPMKKVAALMEEMERRGKRPLPEIERVYVTYYEQGIKPFRGVLNIRQVIAMHHWMGNTGYSMHDVIEKLAKAAGPLPSPEQDSTEGPK